MDRHAMAGRPGFQAREGVDYMEINCVTDPTELCLYNKVRGKILKTVDAVYQVCCGFRKYFPCSQKYFLLLSGHR